MNTNLLRKNINSPKAAINKRSIPTIKSNVINHKETLFKKKILIK